MKLTLPIIQQLYDDDDVTPTEVKVWRKALRQLDVIDWREIKYDIFASAHHISEPTVRRCFARLVELGFLQRRPRVVPGKSGKPTYEFRVPISRELSQEETLIPEPTVPASDSPAKRATRSLGKVRTYSKGVV